MPPPPSPISLHVVRQAYAGTGGYSTPVKVLWMVMVGMIRRKCEIKELGLTRRAWDEIGDIMSNKGLGPPGEIHRLVRHINNPVHEEPLATGRVGLTTMLL